MLVKEAVLILVIVEVFGSSAGEEFPEPALFLPLNNQYGWRDMSKNRLATASAGVSLATGPNGKPGGSYYFYGVIGSYVEVPKSSVIQVSQSMTLSFWVYIESGSKMGAIIHYDTANIHYAFHIYDFDGVIFIRGGDSTFQMYSSITSKRVKANSWAYVAYTYDYNTGEQRIYLNGIEWKASNNIGSHKDINTNYRLVLGGQKNGDSRIFRGRISCLQLYKTALSETQILTTKKYCDRKEFPEPVLFLPLNKQFGTRDISKNKHQTVKGSVSLSPGPDGKPDGSYYFQGTSSAYVDVVKTKYTDTRYSITISAWVYIQSGATVGPIIHFNTEDNRWAMYLFISSDLFTQEVNVRVIDRKLLFNSNALVTSLLPTDNWRYLTMTYDYLTGVQNLYVDDKPVKTQNVGKHEIGTHFKVKIGGQKISDGRIFKGRISCVQIYDYALTKEEISVAKSYCNTNDPFTQCFTNVPIQDTSRSTSYTLVNQHLSDVKALSVNRWYRLPDGQMITSNIPPKTSCGTTNPGWLNGDYPTYQDGAQTMQLCYANRTSACATKANVSVRPCYGFYVYRFEDFPKLGRFCVEKVFPDTSAFNDVMYISTNKKRLSSHMMYEIYVTEVSKCLAYCLYAGDICKSFNWINNSRCQLNNGTQADKALGDDSSCVYHQLV